MWWRRARKMDVPIDEDFRRKALGEANTAQRDMLLESATRDDLIALVTLLEGENKKLKADLATVTFAARLNADTIKAMQRERGDV